MGGSFGDIGTRDSCHGGGVPQQYEVFIVRLRRRMEHLARSIGQILRLRGQGLTASGGERFAKPRSGVVAAEQSTESPVSSGLGKYLARIPTPSPDRLDPSSPNHYGALPPTDCCISSLSAST